VSKRKDESSKSQVKRRVRAGVMRALHTYDAVDFFYTLLARIIHELPTAVADSSENTGAPSACSTCCQAHLRALQSEPPCVFTTLDALATPLHE